MIHKERIMVSTDYKITEARRTAWLEPFTAELRSVLVFPNPSSSLTSFICDEAEPESATEEKQVILWSGCFAAHAAGAEIIGTE
jgi:hypothetical protein